MGAYRIFSTLASLLDVLISSPADGQVLTYQASSSKWKNATPASGGSGGSPNVYSAIKSGYYWSPPLLSTSSGSPGLGYLCLSPIVMPSSATATAICLEITSGASGGTVRLGIYADAGGVPGTLILDAGTISGTLSGLQSITISQALTGGTSYWIGGVQQGINRHAKRLARIGLPTNPQPGERDD